MINFEDKLIFILGANGTIGHEIVKLAVENNAKVLCLDLNDSNIKDYLCKKVFYRFFDSTDFPKLESNIAAFIDEFGTPDIFINTSYPRDENWINSNVENLSIETFRNNLDLHLNSYCISGKFIADHMKANKINGSIILLNSIYGVLAQDEQLYNDTNLDINLVYPAIKGGITSFTRQMGAVYGKHKIRVNSVAAGGIMGKISGKQELQSNNFVKNYTQKVPLKRMATERDIANCVLFLASDLSLYITGQTIMVDGGYSLA